MKDAPWAPIYNEKHITYHSARIGADAQCVHRSVRYPAELSLHLREGRAVRDHSQIRYLPDLPCWPRSKCKWFLCAAFEPGPRTVVK